MNGFSPLRQQGEFICNHKSVTLFQVFPHQILLLFKRFLLVNYNFNYLNYIFNLIYNISVLSKLIKISLDFLIAFKKKSELNIRNFYKFYFNNFIKLN